MSSGLGFDRKCEELADGRTLADAIATAHTNWPALESTSPITLDGCLANVRAMYTAAEANCRSVVMDDLDAIAQPRCPDCGVVMRTEPHAYVCPHCGHLQLLDDVEMPPGFNGPSIHSG